MSIRSWPFSDGLPPFGSMTMPVVLRGSLLARPFSTKRTNPASSMSATNELERSGMPSPGRPSPDAPWHDMQVLR